MSHLENKRFFIPGQAERMDGFGSKGETKYQPRPQAKKRKGRPITDLRFCRMDGCESRISHGNKSGYCQGCASDISRTQRGSVSPKGAC